jgi:catechol 2,3-dioxygenase-like lactoylglutathione lyase family enzyme
MAPVVVVTGLDHVVLTVADVERSLGFYLDTLGLAGVRVEEWRRGEVPFPSVRIDATTIIDLFPGDASGSSLDHLCLTVEPVDLAALAASGQVEVVRGPTDGLFGAQGFATSLYLADPDGNTVELRNYSENETGVENETVAR